MKPNKILMLIGSVCLALVLILSLVASCGPATPEGAAEEIAALESEIDELESNVAAKDAEISDLEDEIAELTKPAEAIDWGAFDWRFQSSFAAGEIAFPVLQDIWDEIYEETNGQFKITTFYEDDIVPGMEVPRATGDGVIEMGEFAGAYSAEVPVGACDCSVPCLWAFKDPYQVPGILEGLGIFDILSEAYAEDNQHFLGFEYCPAYPCLYSTVPIRHVEDFDGVIIRVSGDTARVYETFGASTTALPFSEAYMAQKLGTIDALTWSVDVMWAMSMYEVADYWILPGLSDPTAVTMTVNMDAWNSLPEEYQQLLTEKLGTDFWNRLVPLIQAGYQDGLNKADEGDYEIIWLPDEDMAKIRQAAFDIAWQSYADKGPRCAQIIDILKSYYGMD